MHEALGELAEIDVQLQRVGRDFQALGMSVMLDMGDAPIAQVIGGFNQFFQSSQHGLIGFGLAAIGRCAVMASVSPSVG